MEGQDRHSEGSSYRGTTLCWLCRNAVPSPELGTGCSWSMDGKPVDGWDAHRRDVHGYKDGKLTAGAIESYRVRLCPKFQRG